MPDIHAIARAARAIEAAIELTRSIAALSAEAAIDMKVKELLQRLTEAQEFIVKENAAHSNLLQKEHVVERPKVNLTAWERERAKYLRKEIGKGKFVYAYEPSLNDQTPTHYICEYCCFGAKKSILRGTNHHIFGMQWHCPTCKTDLTED